MTAKRFEYKNHKVYDNLTGETHSSNMVSVNVLNELAEENEQLQHDATILIQANQDYRKENEQLKSNLIDHSALISMLEDYQALKIEETLWNLTDAKSEEEFNELYKPYWEKAKRCWR